MGKKAASSAKGKAKIKATAAESETTRKDQSNMVTQLKKASASESQKELLKLYQSLPRFSDRKTELLNKWRADKSCVWVQDYSETHERSAESTDQKARGYGTVFVT